jgi:hypothetical protein
VIEAGENIVRALLADPGVRLLYKPHPLTGSVDARAGAADLRIRALVRAANRERTGERPADDGELSRRTGELDRLTIASFRTAADSVERMLLQSTPEPGRAEAVARATAAWERAYWASLPEWEHQVVTDARPALYACFNQADLLVSDVSSVVSDFLASGKPYAVANTTGLSEAAFRAAFPTAGAATVLAPDAVGVRELLDAVRQPGPDELAEARAELKRRLLGADEPSSQERFDMAVQALCAVARNRRVPGQRRDEETMSVSGTLIPPG